MQTALTYRTNRDLFSNYYLDEHLPEIVTLGEFDGSPSRLRVDKITRPKLEAGNEIINRAHRPVESMVRRESLSIVGGNDGY
jgi:hypothetical protein